MVSLKRIVQVGVHNYLVKTRPNLVIEGGEQDRWYSLNFLKSRIKIDRNASVLNDYTFKYKLYGKTKDFENILEINNPKEKEQIIKNFFYYIGRPRTIILRDGRIFIEEKISKEKGYVSNCLPTILNQAKGIFRNRLF